MRQMDVAVSNLEQSFAGDVCIIITGAVAEVEIAGPKCKRLIMLPFPAMSPDKLKKCMSEWKCISTLKRVFPI